MLQQRYLEPLGYTSADGERWRALFCALPEAELRRLTTVDLDVGCVLKPQASRDYMYYMAAKHLLPRDSSAEQLHKFWTLSYCQDYVEADMDYWSYTGKRLKLHRFLEHWQFQGSGGPVEDVGTFERCYDDVAPTDTLTVLGPLLQMTGQPLLWLMQGLAQGLGRFPRYPSGARAPASSYECGFAPFAAISSSSLVIFRQLAIYFVVFEAELIFLYPWCAALLPGSALGSALSFYGALPFLLCLLLGFGLEIRRDALKL